MATFEELMADSRQYQIATMERRQRREKERAEEQKQSDESVKKSYNPLAFAREPSAMSLSLHGAASVNSLNSLEQNTPTEALSPAQRSLSRLSQLEVRLAAEEINLKRAQLRANQVEKEVNCILFSRGVTSSCFYLLH